MEYCYQERTVPDMEVEIVTFVVKESAQLIVPPHRQEKIKVGSRFVNLNRVFDLKQYIWPRPFSKSGLWIDNTSSINRYLKLIIVEVCICVWNEMLIISFQPRATTVWIPLHMSTEIGRLGEGLNWCPLECRLSIGKPFPRRPRKTLVCQLCHRRCICFFNQNVSWQNMVLRDKKKMNLYLQFPFLCMKEFRVKVTSLRLRF